jgi:hypothetical protein
VVTNFPYSPKNASRNPQSIQLAKGFALDIPCARA